MGKKMFQALKADLDEIYGIIRDFKARKFHIYTHKYIHSYTKKTGSGFCVWV